MNTFPKFEELSLNQIAEEIKRIPVGVIVEVEDDKKSKDELDEKVVKNIINDFANMYNTDVKTALVAIVKIIQDGGTNFSRSNMTRNINKINFELSELRQIIKINDRFGTVRKLAKTLRNIIVVISKINKWPGPLYKEIQRINPSLILSEEDSVYCSEFNSDNYELDMPLEVRKTLQQREQKIRDDQNRFLYKKMDIKRSKIRRTKNK